MAKIVFDNELVSTLQNNFVKEKDSFSTDAYTTFTNSYLNNNAEPIIAKMASNLNEHYNTINKGYNSINHYWTDYMDASNSLETSLTNFSAVCSNATVNSFLSSFVSLTTSSSTSGTLTLKKMIKSIFSTKDLNTNSTSSTNYSEYIKDIDSKKYKVTNYSDLCDTSKDKGIIHKTTVGQNGEDISYSYKVTTKKGTVVYYDKDGNVVKKINTDGTVEIGDETVHSDSTVTTKSGYTKLNDGNYYKENEAGNGSELKLKDGTKITYDKDGNITKIKNSDESYTRTYDENNNSTGATYTKSSKDGYTYRNYNSDGSYEESVTTNDNVTTTTKYDKNGNVISVEKEYSDVDENGVEHGTYVEKDGTKYYYSGSGLASKETTNSSGDVTTTKYDTKGNVSETTTTTSEGTTTKTDKWGTKVTDSDGTSTKYDENGNLFYTEDSAGTTYYHDDGSYTTYYNDGSSKGYYEDGTVQFESNSDNSLTTWYDENGNFVEKREILDDGVQHFTYSDGREKYFDENYDEIDYNGDN